MPRRDRVVRRVFGASREQYFSSSEIVVTLAATKRQVSNERTNTSLGATTRRHGVIGETARLAVAHGR